jgi:hypothetical protein
MKNYNKNAVIGLKALQRAARKVAEDARKNNYKIPIWENNRIKFVIPEIIQEQGCSVDQCSSDSIEKQGESL